MAVDGPLADADRRGDVAGRDGAVPPGVLRGHGRVAAGVVQIGYGGGVSAGEHLGVARHLQVRVDEEPTAFHGLPDAFDEGVRPHSDAPHEGAGVDELAVGQQDTVVRGLLDGGAHAHLDAPLPQHPVCGAREPFVHLGQHPRRDVEQQPARLPAVRQGPLADLCLGVALSLRRDLGAGVAGADHHEGAPCGAALRVVSAGGELHLTGDVVTQVQGLGQAPEAVRVLGDPGDGQQLVDAADGEHEPVVGQCAAVALGAGVVHGPRVEVDAVGLAEHQPDARQGPRQGDGHPARLQEPGRDLGQQGQVQEVVGRVEQGDVGLVPHQLRQGAGRAVAGEAGTDDHDAGSTHGSPPALSRAS